MRSRAIYVETFIRADLDTIWQLTQNTDEHPRWDLRFRRITPTDRTDTGAQRFRYEARIPFHTIEGTGISIGDRSTKDGTRTSALRYSTTDRLCPMAEGRGYWRYVPAADGVRFLTGYDYRPAWGAWPDRLGPRWLIGWMTAWSFDRLRIWAETGTLPPTRSMLTWWRPDRPRARRCRRRPPNHLEDS